MGFQIAIILLAVIMALLAVAWRSFQGTIPRCRPCCLGGGWARWTASYYAAIETRSVPWAVAFGVVAIASAAVAVRHLLGERIGRHET